MNDSFNDAPVVFEYKYMTGNKLFNKRPKFLERVSEFKGEEEYLVYPLTVFRVQKIIPPEEDIEYTRIILVLWE